MPEPLFRKLDCLRIPVPDIDSGLAFYRDRLGHDLLWRTDTQAGLRMPDADAEIVIQTETKEPEPNLLVASADEAATWIAEAGGGILVQPFDIQIGGCAVVHDPWCNQLVLLDMAKGALITDGDGNVVGNAQPSP